MDLVPKQPHENIQGQTQEWWGREKFSVALALEGAGEGQEAGEGWWGWFGGCITPSFAMEGQS